MKPVQLRVKVAPTVRPETVTIDLADSEVRDYLAMDDKARQAFVARRIDVWEDRQEPLLWIIEDYEFVNMPESEQDIEPPVHPDQIDLAAHAEATDIPPTIPIRVGA